MKTRLLLQYSLFPIYFVLGSSFYSQLLHQVAKDCRIIIVSNGFVDPGLGDSLSFAGVHLVEWAQLDHGSTNVSTELNNVSDILSSSNQFVPMPHSPQRYSRICTFTILFLQNFVQLTQLNQQVDLYSQYFIEEAQPTRTYFILMTSKGQVQLLREFLPESKLKFRIVVDEDSSLGSYNAAGDVKILQVKGHITGEAIFKDYVEGEGCHGRIMRITTPVLAGWITDLKRDESGQWVVKRGITAPLLGHLFIRFNFTPTYFPSSDGGGAGMLVNGTWTGAVGDVVSGRAQMVTQLATTFQRSYYVDITRIFYFNKYAFTVARPPTSYSWKSIYRPLSPTLWAFTFFFILLTAASLWYLMTFDLKSKSLSVKSQALKVISFTLDGLLDKGSGSFVSSIPWSFYIRWVIALWLLVCVVLVTAYRSKLMSVLMFPELGFVPRTYDELANSNFRPIMYYIKGIAYTNFILSTNPTLHKIRARLELETDYLKCFEAVLHNRAACLSWYDVGAYVGNLHFSDQYGRTPFAASTDFRWTLLGGILVKRHAYFLPNFNRVIAQATDRGLIQKWIKMDGDFVSQLGKSNRKEMNDERNQESLLLVNLSGAFMVVGFGLLAGSSMFLIEFGILYVHQRSWKNKRNFKIPALFCF